MRFLPPAAKRLLLGSFVLSAPLILPAITNAQTASTGSNFTTLSTTVSAGGEPPDSMGAVGISNWTQFNNQNYAVFNKVGTQLQNISPSQFWVNAGIAAAADGNLSDPRLLYDPLSQRWFATIIRTTPSSTNNSILLARSETSNPISTGGASPTWRAVTITNTSGTFYDYPTLGLNADGVAVGTINFPPAGATTVSLYSIPKADLLLSTPSLARQSSFINQSANTFGFLLQPVVNTLATSVGGVMPVLSPSNTTFTQFNRSTISGTAAAGATYGGVVTPTITTYSFAPNANQPGSANSLDTIDDRFSGNVIQVGNLIYATNVVNDAVTAGRPGIRFTVLNATTNAVVFQQTLTQSGFDLFFPSVAINPSGDVVIGFTRSGTANPAGFASSAALIGQTSNFTSWTFGTPIVLAAGQGTYNGSRWGDYSATTLDPADPGIAWTTQEFKPTSGTNNAYATRATEVIPTVVGIAGRQNEIRWSNTAGGSFGTGSNYFTGSAPGAADHAIFSRGDTTYTVSFAAGTTTNDRASVRQGTVTFSIPSGATYNLTNTNASTPSLAVAEFQGIASLTVSGGGTLSSVNTIVGGQFGGSGTLTIDGTNTTWNNSAALTIGGPTVSSLTGGTGAVVVQNGGAANITGVTNLQTAVSTLTVSGTSTFSTGGLTNSAGTSTTAMVTLTNAGSSLVINPASGSFTYSSRITGAGTVTKTGNGTQILTGASNYSGATNINGGSLIVNGSITSAVTINGGTLGGTGSTGAVTLAGGTLAPGNSPGILTTSSITVSSTSSVFSFELGGTTPGTNYDQLAVNGTVNLGGAQLNLTLINSFTPTVGNTFTLINNDLSDLVTNTFAGLPDGALFNAAGFNWQILYNTGTGGNDVVLTSIAAIPEPATIAMMGISVCGVGLVYWRRRRQQATELNQRVRR